MIRVDLIGSIRDILERQAASRPQAPAFRDERRAIDYAGLADATARIAAFLQQAGVKPQERVAVYLPNSVDWVETCIGVVRAGAIAVPISFDATPDEIAYRLADAQCVAAFSRPDRMESLRALCDAEGLAPTLIAHWNGESDALRSMSPAAAQPRDPEDIHAPAFIVYTSGTTGKAKGVLLSLGGMLWVTAACWTPVAGLSQDDYILNSLPLYHSYALNLIVISTIATGASAFLMDGFSTSRMAELLASGEPFTVLPGVPTVFHYILQRAQEENVSSLGSMRICISAGAILAGTLNRDFEERFGVKLLDGYGITETSTMVTINWPEGGRPMGSCGLPLPGLAVRLVDRDDNDVARGEEGELIVRGPNVMLGYHDKPEATAEALRGGWYRTGDLARSDENGFLTITGRLKEIIIRGGQNIAPAEVEEVVATFPAVLDCAVVGIPHAHLGEVPAAFVIAREGHAIDADAIVAHCGSRLSAYKVPALIHVVDAIPRTGSGKILRFKLKALVTEG